SEERPRRGACDAVSNFHGGLLGRPWAPRDPPHPWVDASNVLLQMMNCGDHEM
ncbi:hypothetical protein T484DRAFT_1985128, partial [Baffinella frigidus]